MQVRILKIAAAGMAFAMLFATISATTSLAGAAKPEKKDKAAPPPPPAKIEDIHVGGVWTRAARKGETTHVFLSIENKADVPVRLRGGHTDVAKYHQLIRFKMRGPYLSTSMVGPVPVEAHERYVFEPGVVAIELRELDRDLKRGDVLPITLEFARAGTIEVEAEIDSRSAVRYPPPGELPPAKAKAH